MVYHKVVSWVLLVTLIFCFNLSQSSLEAVTTDLISPYSCLALEAPIDRSVFTVYAEVPGDLLQAPLRVILNIVVGTRGGEESLKCVPADEAVDIFVNRKVSNESQYIGTIPRGNMSFSEERYVDFGSYILTLRGKSSGQILQSIVFDVVQTIFFKPEEEIVFTNNIRRYHHVTIGRGTYGVKEIWEDVDESIYDISPWNITIGNFCSFSSNVSFLLFKSHIHDYSSVTTYPFAQWLIKERKFQEDISTDRNVSIGNDVWVGHGAIFINAVKIGDGAVIGAHAVVRENVPAYAVVMGNPAKIVKYRFSEEIIRKLLTIRWWEWSDHKIIASQLYLLSIEDFVDRYYLTS